jgi:hypothetical protein
MTMRVFFLAANTVAAALLSSTAAIAGPLAGTYSSPLGPVTISEKDGNVVGTIAGKNACSFPKGQKVIEGSRLDDSIVGTLHACKTGDGCAGPVEGAAMLLITKGGATLSGAVHLDAAKCETPLKGDSIILKKAQSADKATTTQKQPIDKKAGSPRERAEKLSHEAEAMMKENDGNAEGARAKFQEAVAADSTYGQGYVGVGVTYYVRERYDEAIEWYKKALEVDPADGDAYYNMGCVYALKGDTEQALRYLRIAIMNGYVQPSWDQDPDLKSLQGNATFEKYKKGQTE